MVHSPPLATADEIVLQHAELLQVLADVRKRNKGGRNDKHDTARVRFIKDFALRGLRFGKLVPTADLEMIRLEPKAQLSGPKLASMDAWAKRHAPDPRSANQGVAIDLTVEQQATLLRWVAKNAADFAAPLKARRGAPAAYKLHFGAYNGHTLGQLARASASGGRKSLLPNNSTAPEPGEYLLWLASKEFTFNFPYHVYLYLALRQLEADGCFLFSERVGGHKALVVCAEARACYAEYARSLMTPYAGEVDPYENSTGNDGGSDNDDDGDDGAHDDAPAAIAPAPTAAAPAAARTGTRAPGPAPGPAPAAPAAAAPAAPTPAAAPAMAPAAAEWTPMGEADVYCNAVSRQQNAFLERVVEQMASGERPAFEDMERLEVTPPDPLCVGCVDEDGNFDDDAWHLLPIHFWSPGTKWHIETPCKNHGWAHARYMRTYPGWRQRRVEGVFTDFTIAGQRVECSECKCEYMRLKALKEAAQAHNPRAQRLAELKAQMEASSYRGSTLDAKVNKLWFERYPGLAIRIPAVLTNRKGVSNELMMLLARAARTPQGSHDLEAALHEYRALANAKSRLSFYCEQRRYLSRDPHGTGVTIKPYTVGISQVSDTYLTEMLLHYYETHEQYMLQWSEQHVSN